jgi:hypothetical protein
MTVPNEFDFRVTSKNGHRPTGPVVRLVPFPDLTPRLSQARSSPNSRHAETAAAGPLVRQQKDDRG